MQHRFFLIVAALAPLASCTPAAPGSGSLAAQAASARAIHAPRIQAPLAPGWFAREFGYRVVMPFGLPAQPSPASLVSTSVAEPFVNASRTADDAQRALDCLTAAVYYEARSEPVEGQRAVAQVVLNRVRNPNFPSSVCGVVFQGSERSTGCQFTFTCDGSMDAPREEQAWERSKEVARAALAGDVDTNVGLATNYHANWMVPWWASSLDRVAEVGSQIFYRWKGAVGSALGFNQHYSGIEPEDTRSSDPGPMLRPALMRVAVAGGGSVAIHRGGEMEMASSQGATAVRVHRGTDALVAKPDTATDAPQDALAAKVTVHRGTSLSEADPI